MKALRLRRRPKRPADPDWEEHEHPRAAGGRFGEKPDAPKPPARRAPPPEEDDLPHAVKVDRPTKVYRVVPEDVPGSEAFAGQDGKGVYVFTDRNDALAFRDAGGGKVLVNELKPHTQMRVGDFDIELLGGAKLGEGGPQVFANLGDSGLYPAGTQLYVRDQKQFSGVISRLGRRPVTSPVPMAPPAMEVEAMRMFGESFGKSGDELQSLWEAQPQTRRDVWIDEAKLAESQKQADMRKRRQQAMAKRSMGGTTVRRRRPPADTAKTEPRKPRTSHVIREEDIPEITSEEFQRIVQQELDDVPPKARAYMEAAGFRVVTGTKMTVAAPYLKGQTPRGWPPGSTWDMSDGGYGISSNILIAAEYRQLRDVDGLWQRGTRTATVVAHEMGHAVDFNDHGKAIVPGPQHALSNTAWFVAAHRADVAALSEADRRAANYYIQPGMGNAGPQEAFAELYASYNSPTYDVDHGHIKIRQRFPKTDAAFRKIMKEFA